MGLGLNVNDCSIPVPLREKLAKAAALYTKQGGQAANELSFYTLAYARSKGWITSAEEADALKFFRANATDGLEECATGAAPIRLPAPSLDQRGNASLQDRLLQQMNLRGGGKLEKEDIGDVLSLFQQGDIPDEESASEFLEVLTPYFKPDADVLSELTKRLQDLEPRVGAGSKQDLKVSAWNDKRGYQSDANGMSSCSEIGVHCDDGNGNVVAGPQDSNAPGGYTDGP
jgi:hypothetical protein